MPFIVNMSSIHKLHPISKGIEAFCELCDKYSNGCCSRRCPSIFSKFTNKAWVMRMYNKHLSQLINSYKLGKLSSEEFLKQLSNVFSFLKEDKLTFPEQVVRDFWEKRNEYVVLKNMPDPQHLTKKYVVLALLEKAWNAIIDVPDPFKFKHLTKECRSEPLYLISNSNELNAHKILNMLRDQFRDIKWNSDIDISNTKKDEKPIEIAPNVYLCLSYKFGCFKTDGLLSTLVKTMDARQIRVVSQYENDLVAARQLGVASENTHTADSFYPNKTMTLPLQKAS